MEYGGLANTGLLLSPILLDIRVPEHVLLINYIKHEKLRNVELLIPLGRSVFVKLLSLPTQNNISEFFVFYI